MFSKHSTAIHNELSWLFVFLLIYFVLGWFSHEWLILLAFFFAIYVVRQLRLAYQFEVWMTSEQASPPPQSGLWDELCYLVLKNQRSLVKRAELETEKSKQFRAASMAMPIAILSITKNHRIEWFNASAEQLLNIHYSDVGHRLEALVREPIFVDYLKQHQFETPLYLSSLLDQKRVYRCQVLPYDEGHWLVLFEDVHELYHNAQIRRDFVANASHELRTPLTVLNGYLETMVDMPLEALGAWQKPIEQMNHQSHRMMNIIEDLLVLSKVEADALTEKAERIAVDELLKEIEVDMRYLYEEDYQFHFKIQPGLAIFGQTDAIKSVLLNLISNAVRYTPGKGIIKVTWQKESDCAVFSVEDNGLGISSEHIPRLTERFYRVDTARSRETGGTGLGLAIVKHILEHHQSELEVKSLLGSGSTFSCRFCQKMVAE